MNDDQITTAARMWNVGLDSIAIAKAIFGGVYRCSQDGVTKINCEAIVCRHLQIIRQRARRNRLIAHIVTN